MHHRRPGTRLHFLLLFSCVVLAATAAAQAQPNIGAQKSTVTYAITVDTGWNLLSIPVSVSGGTKDSLFPTAVSGAYDFDGSYTIVDTLMIGKGFWIKFSAAETIDVDGDEVFEDTIGLKAGWNIIGVFTTPVAVGAVGSEPAGAITSNFFGFIPDSGYKVADTLFPGRGYWVKTNEPGAMLLNVAKACPGVPTVDHGGKTYHTVQIGSQCWLAENLDVGTMIQNADTALDNGTIEKYCLANDTANCAVFGGYYHWDEAMAYLSVEGVQGICPAGWHLPSLAEFDTLRSAVNGEGNRLKAIGQGSGAGAGTNTSGFSALLAGDISYAGNFNDHGSIGYFWSSTAVDTSSANFLTLYDNDLIGSPSVDKNYGFSVRCLKGEGWVNGIPDPPSSPFPLDNSSENIPDPTLSWTGGDPDSDPLTYDVYFGTDNPPVTKASNAQTDTAFSVNGLLPATAYYWMVVARDDHGDSAAGPVWKFTTRSADDFSCPGTPTVLYDGKTYRTAQIGSQCWLKENLEAGSMILSAVVSSDNGTIEKYCYNNDTAYCSTYGGLYRWSEAMQYVTTPGAQGICPPGWHIPTINEFQILDTIVSGDANALKAIGQGNGPGAGTNTSGFSALIAGWYNVNFYYIGSDAAIWTSTESSEPSADFLYLWSDNSTIWLDQSNSKSMGFSVRCLKD